MRQGETVAVEENTWQQAGGVLISPVASQLVLAPTVAVAVAVNDNVNVNGWNGGSWRP